MLQFLNGPQPGLPICESSVDKQMITALTLTLAKVAGSPSSQDTINQ